MAQILPIPCFCSQAARGFCCGEVLPTLRCLNYVVSGIESFLVSLCVFHSSNSLFVSLSVPMQDPRAAMQRGALPANVPTPRGLLGDAPNDPRGGTLMTVTGEVEPR